MSFRNVFQEQTEFVFVVDSPQFVLGRPGDVVPAKTSRGVPLTFQADAKNPRAVVNAKLLVSSKARPQLPPWVFYLQGTPPPST